MREEDYCEAYEYMSRQAKQYSQISTRHNGACDDEAEFYEIAAGAIRWKMRVERVFWVILLIACCVAAVAMQIRWPE